VLLRGVLLRGVLLRGVMMRKPGALLFGVLSCSVACSTTPGAAVHEGAPDASSHAAPDASSDAVVETSAPAVDAGQMDAPDGDAFDATTGAPDATDATIDSSPDAVEGAAGGDADGGLIYTLIDDMEHGAHGPIELDSGFSPPETPAYWFNLGATKPASAGPPADTANPAIGMFTFSDITPSTLTLNGKTSTRGAHQSCVLNEFYDVCGIGVEFAQVPDAGSGDASVVDAAQTSDASIPEHTVPFDISLYKGITFWGRSAQADGGGGIDVKVSFPDTDTDPRGGVCNSAAARATGPNDLSKCFNSYAVHVSFTSAWAQYTVMFSDLTIDSSFGYQSPAAWSGTNVYGINWQTQDVDAVDASGQPMDLWLDDVYFVR
jgi:hypothetical protein